MKKVFILLVSIMVLTIGLIYKGFAQSIRKNYQEMTQSEKNELVDAFYQLRNGADLINNLATFHNNNFNAIHYNLPAAPQNDVFLAWHRRQIFEVEQAMQDINPNLSIPFWDWRTDNSVNSPLWDQNFLGQFNNDWNLTRDLGGSGSLPTATDVANVQATSNWLNYSNNFERGIVHGGPHTWTGGAMSSQASPRDPVFYLHHGMVDKLWQEWEEINGLSAYQMTSMPRYDGTYTFNGQTLPLVNPNNIVDSKALGVFFAENQLAQLEDYTVNNTYRSQENFYYQYTIEAKNNFIIPSGKNCKFESVNNIVLKPGFHAKNGSAFLAKIDTDNNINTNARENTVVVKSNKKPFENLNIVQNAYLSENHNDYSKELLVYPNPFTDKITIKVSDKSNNYSVKIYDLQGRILFDKQFQETATLELDQLHSLKRGLYILKVIENEHIILNTKISR